MAGKAGVRNGTTNEIVKLAGAHSTADEPNFGTSVEPIIAALSFFKHECVWFHGVWFAMLAQADSQPECLSHIPSGGALARMNRLPTSRIEPKCVDRTRRGHISSVVEAITLHDDGTRLARAVLAAGDRPDVAAPHSSRRSDTMSRMANLRSRPSNREHRGRFMRAEESTGGDPSASSAGSRNFLLAVGFAA
jgi:hypothetical protein